MMTHLDSQDSLSEQDVPTSHVNIVIDRVSGVDHQTINKLHGLGQTSNQLLTQKLGLSNGAQPMGGDLVEKKGSL